MWHWDQGHLPYFEFDAIRALAKCALEIDFKHTTQSQARLLTGLDFAAPATHSPWRNYSRALKLCLLVNESGDHAIATPVAANLAILGQVGCNDFFHFLVRTSTEPSPALSAWESNANFRYPLAFSLKYLLAKCSENQESAVPPNEIIGAYATTQFIGTESFSEYVQITKNATEYVKVAKNGDSNLIRQARESLKVISQLTYLYLGASGFQVSLSPMEARQTFKALEPIVGNRAASKEAEIARLASLFPKMLSLNTDHQTVSSNDILISGFVEGAKSPKTHIQIERNSQLRFAYFSAKPTISICDACAIDTAKKYPWTDRVLDLHHLLPLSAGVRVVGTHTTFDDLTAICPTCHRAIHRFYTKWLKDNKQTDFICKDEARAVYDSAKQSVLSASHA